MDEENYTETITTLANEETSTHDIPQQQDSENNSENIILTEEENTTLIIIQEDAETTTFSSQEILDQQGSIEFMPRLRPESFNNTPF